LWPANTAHMTRFCAPGADKSPPPFEKICGHMPCSLALLRHNLQTRRATRSWELEVELKQTGLVSLLRIEPQICRKVFQAARRVIPPPCPAMRGPPEFAPRRRYDLVQ